MRRWLRRLAWPAGAYLLFALISWRLVPWGVRKAFARVPDFLPGFSAGADAVAFDPFALRLTLDGITLRHERLGELASCRRLSAAADPLAAFRLAVGLRELKLDGPRLQFVIAEDGTSLLDALPKDPATPSGPAKEPFIPRVVIGVLEVAGGEFDFASRLPSAPQVISARPIVFRLENLSTIPSDGGSYRLQARTDRSERLRWQGALTLRPARLSGHVAIDGADLSRLTTAAPGLPVRIEKGRLDASSDYELALDSGAVSATLKDARASVDGLLWRLKGSKERAPRGPFSLAVGPAQASVSASALGTRAGKAVVRLDVPVEKSGLLGLRAAVGLRPIAGNAEIDLKDLPLAPFSALAPPPIQASLDAGRLSLQVRASYAAGQAEAQASLSLADLKVAEKGTRAPLVRLGHLAVESARASTAGRSIEVGAVKVERPFLRVARSKDGVINAAAALGLDFSTAPAPAVASAPAASSAPWKVRVRRLSVAGGHVLAQDGAVEPAFSLNLSDARLDVAGLANDGRSTATISAAALLEKAPVSASGVVRLSTSAAWGQLRSKAESVQLPVFSPYSGRFIGYKIDKGAFSCDLDHRIDGRAIATQNHAVIDQMTLGEKVESPDAIKAPVKLGLAILKDRRGVIDLNVPIDGSLDDPDFHIAGAVVKTIANLIVKAAVSPFAALGQLAGGKDDLGKVAFAPGSAALSVEAAARLEEVFKALADRPELLVGVRGTAGRADALAHGDKILLSRLRGEQPSDQALAPAEEARLLKLYKDTLGTEPPPVAQARAALAAQWRADEAQQRTLALARAGAVKDALLAKGLSPARFFSLEPVSGADAADQPTELQLDAR